MELMERILTNKSKLFKINTNRRTHGRADNQKNTDSASLRI